MQAAHDFMNNTPPSFARDCYWAVVDRSTNSDERRGMLLNREAKRCMAIHPRDLVSPLSSSSVQGVSLPYIEGTAGTGGGLLCRYVLVDCRAARVRSRQGYIAKSLHLEPDELKTPQVGQRNVHACTHHTCS